jgi:hypothetical protein
LFLRPFFIAALQRFCFVFCTHFIAALQLFCFVLRPFLLLLMQHFCLVLMVCFCAHFYCCFAAVSFCFLRPFYRCLAAVFNRRGSATCIFLRLFFFLFLMDEDFCSLITTKRHGNYSADNPKTNRT